jgi:hypothetical protein
MLLAAMDLLSHGRAGSPARAFISSISILLARLAVVDKLFCGHQ